MAIASQDSEDALTGAPGKASSPSEPPRERMRATVWALAWPTIIANVAMNAGSLVNLYFVHGLGVRAMNAVTWGEQMINLVFSVAVGVSVGTTALVARSIGAKDGRSAADATRQSLLLAMALGIITTGLLTVLARPILFGLGADARSMPLAMTYYNWLLAGVVPFFLINTAAAAFRGAGDTRTPLTLLMILVALNIALDSTLIKGFGPLPAMGVNGAGLGTLISRYAGAALFLAALRVSAHNLITGSDSWRLDLDWAKRLMRIGLPSAAQSFLRTIASATYISLLGHMEHGPAVVAALAVGLRSEGLAYMPGMAFNVAAAALVGQSLGAKDPERAARAARNATQMSVYVMAVMGLLFFVFAEPIARMFAAPEAVPYAVSYLRIAALTEPFLAVSMTLTGALQGAGATVLPMLVVVFTMWGVRLPPTWYFGLKLGYGAPAAWWSMSASVAVQGIMIYAAWRKGSWRRARV